MAGPLLVRGLLLLPASILFSSTSSSLNNQSSLPLSTYPNSTPPNITSTMATTKVYFDVATKKGDALGRIVMELEKEKVPKVGQKSFSITRTIGHMLIICAS